MIARAGNNRRPDAKSSGRRAGLRDARADVGRFENSREDVAIDADDLDAAVFGLVLAVEGDDHAGQPFDDVGVARRPRVIGGCADALDDLGGRPPVDASRHANHARAGLDRQLVGLNPQRPSQDLLAHDRHELGIGPQVGLQQVGPGQDADQRSALDHRQAVDRVATHEGSRGTQGLVGADGHHRAAHRVTGGGVAQTTQRSLALVRLVDEPQERRRTGRRSTTLAGHEVCLGNHAEQLAGGIDHRQAADAALGQDAGHLLE